jgi:hypothetical protein
MYEVGELDLGRPGPRIGFAFHDPAKEFDLVLEIAVGPFHQAVAVADQDSADRNVKLINDRVLADKSGS